MITKDEILEVVTTELADQAKRQRGGERQMVSLLEYNEATGDLRCYAKQAPGDAAHPTPSTGYYYVGGLSYKAGVSIQMQAANYATELHESWFQGAQ